jgi:methylmalonyl-CoA/ethylmalonyl-CoA epimerase
MLLKRIDHIGIVVDDLREAQAFLERIGLTLVREFVAAERLKGAFYACGDGQIELIEIVEPIERQERLGQDKARIEHIGVELDDLQAGVEVFKGLGISFTTDEVLEVRNTRNLWTDRATCDGVMYQLVQYTGQDAA